MLERPTFIILKLLVVPWSSTSSEKGLDSPESKELPFRAKPGQRVFGVGNKILLVVTLLLGWGATPDDKCQKIPHISCCIHLHSHFLSVSQKRDHLKH